MRDRTTTALFLAAALLTNIVGIDEGLAQTKIARVGVLSFFAVTSSNPVPERWWQPFRRTLAEHGWIEGKNVSFEYRSSAPGDSSHLTEAAAELVRLKVDLICAIGAPFTRAAYTATRTTPIPIVGIDFTTDPVAEGFAESYGRPGGNLTGVFLDAPEFAGKWLELLSTMVPRLSRIAVLWDPSPGAAHLHSIESMAQALDLQLRVAEVHKPEDIDRAFSAFRGEPQALIILPSPMLFVQSPRLAQLALKHRLPATSMTPLFPEAGGLLGYGPHAAATMERSALFVAKILGGIKPGDLPVERPAKFELVVNLKTAKILGIAVPESILLQADEVIR